MRVAVLGAGIIGVTTAHELARAGAEVTLVERREGVALETSAGNAGVVAPGYVTPWAAPGMPSKVLRTLLAPTGPVVFRPNLDPALWRWIARWLGECAAERFRINKPRMQRLAFYSRERLRAARDELGIAYDRSEGYLQLFRTEKERALAEPALGLLRELGVPHRLVDPATCLDIEPGLAGAAARPVGGLHLPEDEAGDCAAFARALSHRFRQAGIATRFGTVVTSLTLEGGRITGLRLAGPDGPEILACDAVVVALGPESAALLAPLGIDVPIYPVKGYSITLPVRDDAAAPRAALMDEAYKVAITRLGDRVRVAGTAELGSRALTPRQKPVETLLKVVRDWFPRGVDTGTITPWVGARPMTPDGPPILGPTAVPGLFLNLGHGSTGWAMSLGSAKIVADLVTGARPEIDVAGLTIARYA
ncbi:MAG TPA: D-amino acid dehydrogenase [Beijerinckiaceae bacterium]|jgi:D-amino-acid dehydrogenase